MGGFGSSPYEDKPFAQSKYYVSMRVGVVQSAAGTPVTPLLINLRTTHVQSTAVKVYSYRAKDKSLSVVL